MPRPPLDQEAKKEATIQLIKATQTIIFTEGISAVTIRKIAKIAKVNSAILYKYFKDLDELLLFASADLLKDYMQELATVSSKINSPKVAYLLSWKLFCRYSFKYPECMYNLFFGRHSDDLEKIIRDYCTMFPEQFEGVSISFQSMIRSGNLAKRNMEVLKPLFDGKISQKRINFINELTLSYYQTLLNEKILNGDKADNEVLTKRMLYACRQILLLASGLRVLRNTKE